jgi:hypothetical protein
VPLTGLSGHQNGVEQRIVPLFTAIDAFSKEQAKNEVLSCAEDTSHLGVTGKVADTFLDPSPPLQGAAHTLSEHSFYVGLQKPCSAAVL